MAPRFFDIHSHINDASFDEDRSEVLSRMKERNVWGIVVGTDFKSSQDAATLASFSESGVYATIGIHPIDDRNELFREEFFSELLNPSRIVAVGECGLDYSRLNDVSDIAAEKARQKELFEKQVDFAVKNNLPLMLHVRDSDKSIADAHQDLLGLLTEKKKKFGDALRGNVHFFAQTIEVAREYFALNFTISFTGVITFSKEYDEVVRLAPLEMILSETDCPYVSPVPHRGKRNEPIFVEEVVRKIAELRNEDFEVVRAQLVKNASRVFAIQLS